MIIGTNYMEAEKQEMKILVRCQLYECLDYVNSV